MVCIFQKLTIMNSENFFSSKLTDMVFRLGISLQKPAIIDESIPPDKKVPIEHH